MKTNWMNIGEGKTGMVLLCAVLIAPMTQAQQKEFYRDYDATEVIYRGVNNFIRVNVPHDPQTTLVVSCEQCTGVVMLDPDNPEIFNVSAGVGKEVSLQIKAKVDNVEREYQRTYKVYNLPPASLFLDNVASTKELTKQLSGDLSVKYPDEIDLPNWFTVLSWEMECKGETMKGLGNKLSDEALKTISNTEAQNVTLMVRYVDAQRIQRVTVGTYPLKI